MSGSVTTLSGIVVEDGSGVVGANSYISTAFVDAYAALRGNSTWATYTAAQKAAACIVASQYLDATQTWVGVQGAYAQGMQWPRNEAFDTKRLLDVPTNVVPPDLMNCAADLATKVASGTTLFEDLERGGMIKSESVSGLSTTYMDNAPPTTVYGIVTSLSGLTRNNDTLPPAGAGIVSTGSPGMYQGMFDIPGLPDDLISGPEYE